jgi:hypothetical protein
MFPGVDVDLDDVPLARGGAFSAEAGVG